MNHLHWQLAPIDDAAWSAVDAQISQTLRQTLARRRLVPFSGPNGWEWLAGDLLRTNLAATRLRTHPRRNLPLMRARRQIGIAGGKYRNLGG